MLRDEPERPRRLDVLGQNQHAHARECIANPARCDDSLVAVRWPDVDDHRIGLLRRDVLIAGVVAFESRRTPVAVLHFSDVPRGPIDALGGRPTPSPTNGSTPTPDGSATPSPPGVLGTGCRWIVGGSGTPGLAPSATPRPTGAPAQTPAPSPAPTDGAAGAERGSHASASPNTVDTRPVGR